MKISNRNLTFLATCTVLLAATGCQQKEHDTLSFDPHLSEVLNADLKPRAAELDVTAMSLRCSRAGGTLQASVSYRYGGAEHKKNVPSTTPCTTKGKLIDIDFSDYSNIRASSNDAYASDLVTSVLDSALTTVFGSLALNIPASIQISQKYQKELADMNMTHVDFSCDSKTKLVHYAGYYRGEKRKGVLNVSCPTKMDKSPILARLAHGQADKPGYNLLVTNTTSSEQATDFVADFIRVAGPRQSF